jgi:hypothetical protein
MAENVINLSEAEALSGNQDSDFSSFFHNLSHALENAFEK